MTQKAFFDRLATFRDLLNRMDWTPDGVNSHQGYRFLSESKMKGQIGPALTKAGLEWRATYSDVRMLDPVGSMRTHIMLTMTVELSDEDGNTAIYTAFGTAADSGDKAMSKAQTNALKNLIANNWLVSSFDAETEGELESKSSGKSYMTPERLDEAKQALKRREAEVNAKLDAVAPKPEPKADAPAGMTGVQKVAVEKIFNRLKTLDTTDLEPFGGLVQIET